MPLYASAPIAYDGTVYARIDAARWSRDCTKISDWFDSVVSSGFFSIFFSNSKPHQNQNRVKVGKPSVYNDVIFESFKGDLARIYIISIS